MPEGEAPVPQNRTAARISGLRFFVVPSSLRPGAYAFSPFISLLKQWRQIDLVQVVEFPVFDPRDGKIELVENCPVDTLERDGRRLKLRKRYRLAAFDEGKYNLGAAQVLYADKNILDTLRSTDSVYLEVATFQIDSTSQSIYDLKAQKNLPFRFREVSGYVKWGVFFLLMLLAAGYALKRYLASRGKGFGDLFKPAPPLPPHVAAIQALEALHNQKLWQNNRHKQYYSGLTDILRTYIAARWGFGAMEMTSDEIIETMRPEELPDKARMDLTAIDLQRRWYRQVPVRLQPSTVDSTVSD